MSFHVRNEIRSRTTFRPFVGQVTRMYWFPLFCTLPITISTNTNLIQVDAGQIVYILLSLQKTAGHVSSEYLVCYIKYAIVCRDRVATLYIALFRRVQTQFRATKEILEFCGSHVADRKRLR